MRIGIIGAGMAGLSCADGLTAMGHEVHLFDKGRGPGGRMSTRRIDTPIGRVSIDHGAQYFTARDKGFRAQVDRWVAQGHAAPWPVPANDAWIGTPTMSGVIGAMAAAHRVSWGCQIVRIDRQSCQWTLSSDTESYPGFDAVMLAVPAEQATAFLSLHDFEMARQSMLARSQPCWTGMFVLRAALSNPCDMVRDKGIISWAARTNSKPARQGPESWVVQAKSDWSRDHIEDTSEMVAGALLESLSSALGEPLRDIAFATAHRWRYAMSGGLGIGALWNAELRLGACGDWLLGPRVECAWVSGQDLAGKIARTA
jgi:renalase